MNMRVFRNHNASSSGGNGTEGFPHEQPLAGGLQAAKGLSPEHKERISSFMLSIREFVKDKGEVWIVTGKDESGKDEGKFGLRLEKPVREFGELLCEIANENPELNTKREYPGFTTKQELPSFIVTVTGDTVNRYNRPVVELKAIARAKDESYHQIIMKFTIYAGFPEYMLLKVESDGAFPKISTPLGTGAYLYACGRKNDRIFESHLSTVAEGVLNFSP